MRRPDTKESISRLIEKLRSAVPDIVLRTTVIVGFPGETDEQFEELVEFIGWARFDALGCFTYYAESGCRARFPRASSSKGWIALCLRSRRLPSTKTRTESVVP